MKKLFITMLSIFLLSSTIYAQTQTFPRNGVQDERTDLYAFTNATIIQDANTTIEGATLIIKGSLIESIGKGINIPLGATIVDSITEPLMIKVAPSRVILASWMMEAFVKAYKSVRSSCTPLRGKVWVCA